MVQIKIFSGKKAGDVWSTRHFPVRLGRSAGSDIQLEDPGVWDEHCRITLDSGLAFILETTSDALVSVNSQPAQRALLRNGDIIELGSAKVQFWLSPAQQRTPGIYEVSVWALVAAVTFVQIALVYWLSRVA